MAVISKLIPSWASPCAFHVSASIWKEYHLILCPFNRVYSFRVYRVSRYNDSISTPHTSAFVHKLQSYESNIIEPVSASCFVSILFRSVVLSGRERFHRLVEPGILLTFLLPSSFFSFFLFFFFFFLLFPFTAVSNGTSLVHGTFVADWRTPRWRSGRIRPYKGCDLLTFMEYCSNNVPPFNVWQCGEYTSSWIFLLVYCTFVLRVAQLTLIFIRRNAYGAGKNNEKSILTIFSTCNMYNIKKEMILILS